MTNSFNQAMNYLVAKDEGNVYTDDPNDSGGPTKFGVTQKAYSAFLGRAVTREEIAALTLDQVKPFYWKCYWNPLGCDFIYDPIVATAIFDMGVLYGTFFAADFTQEALGNVEVDGSIGAQTLKALNAVSRVTFLVNFRLAVLKRIEKIISINPKQERFRNGWTARADRLLTLPTDPAFNISSTSVKP